MDNIQKHLSSAKRKNDLVGGVSAVPRLSEEQVGQAREIDLLTYLQTHAPDSVRKIGSDTYCLVEHDSFKISNGKWFWHSRGFGGHSALDYLIKVESMKFVDAARHLTGEAVPTHKKAQPRASPPRPPFKLPVPNRNNDKAYAYLRGRGIGKDIINRCIKDGLLYQSAGTHRCVFVGKDGDGVTKFACERGLRDDWKKDVAGSDKRLSFCITPVNPQNCKDLTVFESAIDAIAHMEMFQKFDGYRLSLSGTSSIALTSFLERHPQIENVTLCLDNDEAGRNATSRIIEELGKNKNIQPLKIAVKPPTVGKDYADMLAIKQQQNISQPTRREAGILI